MRTRMSPEMRDKVVNRGDPLKPVDRLSRKIRNLNQLETNQVKGYWRLGEISRCTFRDAYLSRTIPTTL